MLVVPKESTLVVEARVLNKDIGFVREGQSVRIKLEAFPFTTHGILPGQVEHISRDALQDEKLGLVYLARVRMLQSTIRVRGRDVPLGAGLAVQAEIKTGERRIIQYLLSPIAQTLDEAGRER
jgi:hemolysin D